MMSEGVICVICYEDVCFFCEDLQFIFVCGYVFYEFWCVFVLFLSGGVWFEWYLGVFGIFCLEIVVVCVCWFDGRVIFVFEFLFFIMFLVKFVIVG